MYLSLLIVLVTVFATFLTLYWADSVFTAMKRKKSMKKFDREMKGMDYRLGHR